MDTFRYIYITDVIRFWGISPAFFARPRTSQNHPKPMCAQWPAQAASAQLQAEHLQVHEPLHLFGSFRGIALLPPTHLYESLHTFHNPSHPVSVDWISPSSFTSRLCRMDKPPPKRPTDHVHQFPQTSLGDPWGMACLGPIGILVTSHGFIWIINDYHGLCMCIVSWP